jgi:uncharacterized OB-fold protein
MSITRPLPQLRGEEKLFFDAASEGRLVFQECCACGARYGQPRSVCPSCMSEDLVVKDCVGTGTVYSYTVLHRAGHPAFADRVPYTIVLVDLPEGIRVLADMVDGSRPPVEVGTSVQVVFDEVTQALTLPRFRPVEHDGEVRA